MDLILAFKQKIFKLAADHLHRLPTQVNYQIPANAVFSHLKHLSEVH